jgi:hypothetical protein
MEHVMTLDLPGPVATYVDAEGDKNTVLLVSAFAQDAVVRDEEHEYQGVDAIRAWKQAAEKKYQYVMEPLDAVVDEQNVTLHARLTGNFPGSPVEVDYFFTLDGDKIVSLEIR